MNTVHVARLASCGAYGLPGIKHGAFPASYVVNMSNLQDFELLKSESESISRHTEKGVRKTFMIEQAYCSNELGSLQPNLIRNALYTNYHDSDSAWKIP